MFSGTTAISYARSEIAWEEFDRTVHDLILSNKLRRICEVGGGANPTLPIEFVKEHKLHYTIIDVSAEELAKAPPGYVTIVADLCESAAIRNDGEFELVFSKMLAEHLTRPRTFHRNILRILAAGGIALHFFPTLYALPFVVNRLMPDTISTVILHYVAPRDQRQHRKFPAFYRWCRGPTRLQISRFKRQGFHVLSYRGFFGHGYYKRFPILPKLVGRLTTLLLDHPVPALTAYARVLLQKPEEVGR